MFISKSIRTALVTAAALAAFPAMASAIPNNNGGNDDPPPPPNQAPVARFVVTPNPALVTTTPVLTQANSRAIPPGGVVRFGDGDLVKFNGSASSDHEGPVSFAWDLDGNGTYEKTGTATPSRQYTQTGTYHVRLKVTDTGGKISIVQHDLIVHAAPKPKITADKTVALIGQNVGLSAAGSTDDNGIAKYEWDLDGNGTFETVGGLTQNTSFTTLGQHSAALRVTDVYGVSRTASVAITVHRAPTAAFTIAPNPALTGDMVKFDGSTSSDDDPIAKYEWDLDGNGTFETDTQGTATATKAYTAPGTITVKLRVTDDHGVQDVTSQTLTVNPKPVVTTTPDTTAPQVTITPKSAKLGKAGKVTLTIACPMGESTCTGKLALRSLRGARSAALGGVKFSVAGGQQAKVKVTLSKKNRKLVKRLHRLNAQASAVATDAAGNTGTSLAKLVIRR
ncbi:MAG: large repetitive protein [Solirubrobacteraceae bacterium]|nr:large repetitive protein [Solirubrobacteraceae bacterium]